MARVDDYASSSGIEWFGISKISKLCWIQRPPDTDTGMGVEIHNRGTEEPLARLATLETGVRVRIKVEARKEWEAPVSNKACVFFPSRRRGIVSAW
jgi:hypothetical protein